MTRNFDEKLANQTEALARMVQQGFDDLGERLDIRDQVEQHERDIEEIKRTLKLA